MREFQVFEADIEPAELEKGEAVLIVDVSEFVDPKIFKARDRVRVTVGDEKQVFDAGIIPIGSNDRFFHALEIVSPKIFKAGERGLFLHALEIVNPKRFKAGERVRITVERLPGRSFLILTG
jgi:hypothetical protein